MVRTSFLKVFLRPRRKLPAPAEAPSIRGSQLDSGYDYLQNDRMFCNIVGGEISPLLANLYLHWFDYKFHRADGPYYWANARLVRYADDFVILAKYVGGRIEPFVDQTLQDWMALKVNPDKTRTVSLYEPGVGLNFLGYTFRYDRDWYGRQGHYLNLIPSEKSLQRVRDKLREMTDARHCFTPVRDLIERINRTLRGWQAYFSQGYAHQVYRDVDSFTLRRLQNHLHRRSQRGYQKPKE
jgi:RNA-directed DNA polymerase